MIKVEVARGDTKYYVTFLATKKGEKELLTYLKDLRKGHECSTVPADILSVTIIKTKEQP